MGSPKWTIRAQFIQRRGTVEFPPGNLGLACKVEGQTPCSKIFIRDARLLLTGRELAFESCDAPPNI